MNRVIFRLFFIMLVMLSGATAYAADELAVYVFKDRNAGTGLTVALDGDIEKAISDDGSVYFDLAAGAHILGVFDRRKLVYSVKFDSVPGQLADAVINLVTFEDSQGSVQTYLPTETPGERAGAPTGGLLGRVTDVNTGEPVPNARISIQGTNFSTTSNASGDYSLTLPRGVYTLAIDAEDYGSQNIAGIRVVTNIDIGQSFRIKLPDSAATMLSPTGAEIEEVFVIAKYKPTALGEDERYSAGLVDTLGIGELARFGGSDISQSVIRIPSVTVKDGRFVFIRGLGGRYITTTLNGALLPSTDPAKRTVPLDLFPTNFVSQLDVKKQFIASMPGESTGGNLVINTRTYPAESQGRLSVQTGFTQGLTGETVIADPIRGDFDYFGVEDGSRTNASFFRAISDAIELAEDNNDPEARAAFSTIGANALVPDLDLGSTTANPKLTLGGSYGNLFDVGDSSEFGFFLAGNYRNEWGQRTDGIERTYGGDVNQGTQVVEDDFVFEEFSNNLEVSGLLNLGLTTGNSNFSSNTLLSRVTQSRAKQKVGFDGDELVPSIRHSIDWVERQFVSQQFTGDHVFGSREEWILDWQVTGSQANRDAPDRREVRFDLQGSDDIYNLEVPVVTRRYEELEDQNFDFTADVDYIFSTAVEDETKLSAGIQLIQRERDSDVDTFGFEDALNGDDNAPNLLVTDVLNPATITGVSTTGYGFQDKTLANDSYDAELDLNAIWMSFDTLQNETHQFIAGARYEDYKQVTDTFTLQQPPEPLPSELEDSVVLPSVGYNWFFTERQTVRFGLSKTVSRPDFKETSNALFYDPDFDITVRGNPDLQVSDAINADARYQFYWNDLDNLSVGVFYKELDQPIERVLNVASGTVGNSRTFQNADSAEIYGIELEGRKEWGVGDSLTKSFFLAGNASWIDSEVQLTGQAVNTRPLQGQPEYVLNLILGYDDIDNGQELTLLLNQNGDTVSDVGIDGQADIVLEPRLDLTLNYRWYFTDSWQFVFKGENLLDEPVEFTQAGKIYQSWETGREFSFGLNFNF